jgi:hypothetical protein
MLVRKKTRIKPPPIPNKDEIWGSGGKMRNFVRVSTINRAMDPTPNNQMVALLARTYSNRPTPARIDPIGTDDAHNPNKGLVNPQMVALA